MFNGIWLVASEPLTLKGREIKAGERFHISRVHSGALLVTGRATIANPQPPPKSSAPEPEPVTAPRKRGRPRKTEPTERVASTAVAEPEPVPAPPTEPPEPTDPTEPDEPTDEAPRRYIRRDLEAEE